MLTMAPLGATATYTAAQAVVAALEQDDWAAALEAMGMFTGAQLVEVRNKAIALGADMATVDTLVGSLTGEVIEVTSTAPPVPGAQPTTKIPWVPIVIGIVVLGVGYWLYRRRGGTQLMGRKTKSKSKSGRSSDSSVRSPTRTRTEVRSPTSTSTEVRSPTSTSTETDAYTAGNVTVTGGAGSGDTRVTIRGNRKQGVDPRHKRGRDGVRKARIHATDVQDRSRPSRQHATDTRRRARR